MIATASPENHKKTPPMAGSTPELARCT
jgi:hypothetical protein